MGKSGEKWLRVRKSGKKLEKVVKSGEKWGKVGKRGEKWRKTVKNGEKLEKVGTFWMTEKITFDHTSRHFRSIRNFIFIFFKMATSGHFGFRFLPKSIWTSLYSMSVATSNMKLIIIFSQNGRRRPFWFFRFAPKSIGFFHSRSSMAVSIMNLIRALVSQLRETQALVCGGSGGGGGGDGVRTKISGI